MRFVIEASTVFWRSLLLLNFRCPLLVRIKKPTGISFLNPFSNRDLFTRQCNLCILNVRLGKSGRQLFYIYIYILSRIYLLILLQSSKVIATARLFPLYGQQADKNIRKTVRLSYWQYDDSSSKKIHNQCMRNLPVCWTPFRINDSPFSTNVCQGSVRALLSGKVSQCTHNYIPSMYSWACPRANDILRYLLSRSSDLISLFFLV